MIAKIGRSSNLYGALAYNQVKVEKEKGAILLLHNMIETADGQYSVRQLLRSFEPYLIANRNTEKSALHISLNPNPKDQVSDEQFGQIASEYMSQMGYGEQPFVVFKHSDIERSHIHIVTVCVDENGKKISDQFEKVRSMNVCRELERIHGLIPATDQVRHQNDKVFRPVDYRAGDVKNQIASVIRHLPDIYHFKTIGEYNVLLSLFNITIEKVEVSSQENTRGGLLYIALDEKGHRAGHPFKASLFGKKAGLPALELHFLKSREDWKHQQPKSNLKAILTSALRSTNDEQSFKKRLFSEDIDVFIRRNDSGRIYGISFIDHRSKTVFNGSHVSKELSANMINEYWKNNEKPDLKEPVEQQNNPVYKTETSEREPHYLFDFLSSDQSGSNLLEALGSLLPETQGEDYEEQDFANRMKKKRKHQRGNRR